MLRLQRKLEYGGWQKLLRSTWQLSTSELLRAHVHVHRVLLRIILLLIMVDVASIVKLAFALARVPETVKINRGQCELLVDRITSLAGHLERMQSMHDEKLEKSHEVRETTRQAISDRRVTSTQVSPPKSCQRPHLEQVSYFQDSKRCLNEVC